jgi:AraC family transcriptional regulator
VSAWEWASERPPERAPHGELRWPRAAPAACQILRKDPTTAAAPRVDVLAAVHRAIDYVQAHLGGPVVLEDVAHAAGFSPFHFHRVFKGLMGETLHAFTQRQRLERALTMMSRTGAGTLTEIALATGFASSSDFSRAFKQRYGVPPSRFDVGALRDSRRAELLASLEQAGRRPALDRLPPDTNPDGFQARLRELPPRVLAYIRVHDPYHGDGVVRAAERLVAWAEARGDADNRWYGYQWEDPDITPLAQCRYDIAVEVDDVRAQGEIGRLALPAMLVAEVELAGDVALELRALDWLFTTWLPRSGRVPADQPCFEAFVGRPFAHGYEHFELAVHLPLAR